MSDLDWMVRAGTPPKGKRPDFLGDPDTERLLSMVMALTGEVSVLRERLDTVERLLDDAGVVRRDAIEGYRPDAEAGRERGLMIREFIARVMRGPQQFMEAMARDEKPLAEVSRELGEM